MRAERRRKELIAGGEHVGADETLRAIVARDAYDSQRAVAPLRRADDAVELDTSGLDIDQVVEAARAIVLARLGAAREERAALRAPAIAGSTAPCASSPA